MKVAIYARKSKATEIGESTDNQVEMCKNYINANFPGETHTFSVYIDDGFSGKDIRRPQFAEMMQAAKRNSFDQVVVYRLDRISRNIVDFMSITQRLSDQKIGFVSINERFDTTTPMGRAMMQIAAVFAQLERETIAERVADNMLMLSRTGRWLGGRAPYGYSSERVAADRTKGTKQYSRLVIADDIYLVRLIYQKYLELGSVHGVQRFVFDERILNKDGGKLTDTFIKGVLRNPVYCVADETAYEYFSDMGSVLPDDKTDFDGTHGIMPYNRTTGRTSASIDHDPSEWIIAVGEHEGAIAAKDWVRVQRRLNENKNRYVGFQSSTNSYALLSGMLYCAKCGKRMYCKPQNKKGRKDSAKTFFYVCETQKKYSSKACSTKAVMGGKLDRAFLEELGRYRLPESELGKCLLKYRGAGLVVKKQNAELEAINVKTREAQQKLEGLAAIFAEKRGTPMEDVLKEQIDEVIENIGKMRERAAKLEEEKNRNETKRSLADSFDYLVEEFLNGYEKVPVPILRDQLKEFIERIEWNGDTEELSVFPVGAR